MNTQNHIQCMGCEIETWNIKTNERLRILSVSLLTTSFAEADSIIFSKPKCIHNGVSDSENLFQIYTYLNANTFTLPYLQVTPYTAANFINTASVQSPPLIFSYTLFPCSSISSLILSEDFFRCANHIKTEYLFWKGEKYGMTFTGEGLSPQDRMKAISGYVW